MSNDSIRFRHRHSKDDRFIIEVSLKTMKRIFEQSTGIPLTEQMMRNQIEGNDQVIIIEQNRKPIGYLAYSFMPDNQIYWSALVIEPTSQAKGVGKKAVRWMEQTARDKGVHMISGHVQINNSHAAQFWHKNGFEKVGTPYSGSYEIQKRIPQSFAKSH